MSAPILLRCFVFPFLLFLLLITFHSCTRSASESSPSAGGSELDFLPLSFSCSYRFREGIIVAYGPCFIIGFSACRFKVNPLVYEDEGRVRRCTTRGSQLFRLSRPSTGLTQSETSNPKRLKHDRSPNNRSCAIFDGVILNVFVRS